MTAYLYTPFPTWVLQSPAFLLTRSKMALGSLAQSAIDICDRRIRQNMFIDQVNKDPYSVPPTSLSTLLGEQTQQCLKSWDALLTWRTCNQQIS